MTPFYSKKYSKNPLGEKKIIFQEKKTCSLQNIRLDVKLQSVKISLEAKHSSKIYLVILVNNLENTKYVNCLYYLSSTAKKVVTF